MLICESPLGDSLIIEGIVPYEAWLGAVVMTDGKGLSRVEVVEVN